MMTPSPTLFQYYHFLIHEAGSVQTEMATMRTLLRQYSQQNPGFSIQQGIQTGLMKTIGNMNAASLFSDLQELFTQTGNWKPSPQRSIVDEINEAGATLCIAGQLGKYWLDLLNSNSIPHQINNPIYK